MIAGDIKSDFLPPRSSFHPPVVKMHLSETSLFSLELRHGGPLSGLNYSITESIYTYIFMRQVYYKGELFLAPWKKLYPFQHPE